MVPSILGMSMPIPIIYPMALMRVITPVPPMPAIIAVLIQVAR